MHPNILWSSDIFKDSECPCLRFSESVKIVIIYFGTLIFFKILNILKILNFLQIDVIKR